jgi:hypothetical protein
MSRTLLFVSTTLLISATACIVPPEGPKSGAVASGSQLAVVDDIKTWTTTSKEKVAEVEHTDEDGHVIGKSAVYQDKEEVHHQKIWYGVQGTEQLSDEDFFKISGDQASLDQTLAMRADGKKWQHRGIGTMVGGGVGMLVSFFIPNVPVRLGLEVLGGLALSGGYYMTWMGAHEISPETHAVDRSVADRAANQYNQTLGGGRVGLNFAKKF